MGKQTAKQVARREAREAQRRMVAERQERERRLGDLGVAVAEALGRRDALVRERDAAVRVQELKAGQALRKMTEDEGLALSVAAQWCGESVTGREAGRLRRLALEDQEQGKAAGPKAADEPAAGEPAAGMMG